VTDLTLEIVEVQMLPISKPLMKVWVYACVCVCVCCSIATQITNNVCFYRGKKTWKTSTSSNAHFICSGYIN